MDIKVYKLEVDWFSAEVWDDRTIEITATSMFQLMRVFLHETQWIKTEIEGTVYSTQKDLWKKHTKYIKKTTLTFPIISEIR